MKIIEYFTGKDIWEQIKIKGQFDFIDDTFETLFLIKFGQRTLYSGYAPLDSDVISSLIVNRFKSKWDRLLEVEVENFLATNVTLHTKDETLENVWDDASSNTNMVSAFNDTDLVTDDKQVQESNKNLNGQVNGKYKTEVLNIKDAITNLDIISQLNIKEHAMEDVISLIALEIYK